MQLRLRRQPRRLTVGEVPTNRSEFTDSRACARRRQSERHRRGGDMRRTLVGWLLILHALAHASVSTWTTIDLRWSTSCLAALAFGCYMASGLAMLRVPLLRTHWRGLLITATGASFIYLVWLLPKWGMIGVAIDIAVVLIALD